MPDVDVTRSRQTFIQNSKSLNEKATKLIQVKEGNTTVNDFHEQLCVKLGKFEKPPMPSLSPAKRNNVTQEQEKRLSKQDSEFLETQKRS